MALSTTGTQMDNMSFSSAVGLAADPHARYSAADEAYAQQSGPRSRGCRWLYDVIGGFFTLPGDTPRMVHHKLIWMFFLVITMLVSLFGYLGTLNWPMRGVGNTCMGGAVAYGVLLLFFVMHKRTTVAFQVLATLVFTIEITLLDMFVMPTLWRLWALFVVVVDVLLVVEAPSWISIVLVVWVCIWLTVAETEYAVRFGLLDVPGMHSYDERRRRFECDKPPCVASDTLGAVMNLIPQFSVFLLDYWFTRGFAHQVLKEQRRIQASVTASQYIAANLARFDLETAERYLNQEAATLPRELLDSFQTLLANLGSYRPFLPEEFFTHTDTRRASVACKSTGSEDVPGLAHSNVTIVFTDIRQSTALWEHSPAAMRAALDIHSTIIREEMAKYGGYEVKTIGDAFMVAFSAAGDAVRFALSVQTFFASDGVWPKDLCRGGLDDGYDVFSVRIGVHSGSVAVERNVLTGRYDYFGGTVNKASRVEAHGVSGSVTVSEEVMDLVNGGAGLDVLVIPFAEPRMGKGLLEPLQLYALLPKSVTRMEGLVREVCSARRMATLPPLSPTHESQQMGGAASSSEPASADVSDVLESKRTSEGRPVPVGQSRMVAVTSASVGVIKFTACTADIDWESERARTMARLMKLNAALKSTGGLMSSVVNNIAVVSWGIYGRRTQHLNEAARFLICLYEEFEADSTVPFHAGLASGPVASGPLRASSSQHFVSLLGPCVDLGMALCHGAAELDTYALLASVGNGESSYESDPYLTEFLRPVDEWNLGLAPLSPIGGSLPAGAHGAHASSAAMDWYFADPSIGGGGPLNGRSHTGCRSNQCTTVYELRFMGLLNAAEAAGGVANASPPSVPREWSKWSYWKAFFAKDMLALAEFAQRDPTVAKVRRLLETNSHLAHAWTVCREGGAADTGMECLSVQSAAALRVATGSAGPISPVTGESMGSSTSPSRHFMINQGIPLSMRLQMGFEAAELHALDRAQV